MNRTIKILSRQRRYGMIKGWMKKQASKVARRSRRIKNEFKE